MRARRVHQNVSLPFHLDAVTVRRHTFGIMKPSIDQLRSSMLARRYNVVALAFVLCAWMVAAAMHLHLSDNDKDAGGVDPRPCTYCLAFSGGAAPPPDHRIPEVVADPIGVVAFPTLPAKEQVAASFYFSRGPPAI
jgi:hypothetical protein